MATHAIDLRGSTTWPTDPYDVHRWQQGPSQAIVSTLSPRVIGLEAIGALEAGALEVIEPCLVRFFEDCPGDAHLFCDCEWLERHDGAVRDVILGLLHAHRERWAGVHVLFSSALIGVTVTAAGLFLGCEVKGYRRRPEFRRAVEQALGSP